MTKVVTLAGYAVLVAAMVALEVVARRAGPVGPVATLGRALGVLRASAAARLVVLAGWLWLGWHLFARAHH